MMAVPIPTIVLLHGQPDSSASFWSLRRELGRRLPAGVRVLAPDRPGYGANLLPPTGYAGNLRWLQGWLERVEAGPTVLVGHSWAGGVTALAAAQRPSWLAGLVLLASVGPGCLTPVDPLLAAPVLGNVLAYATLQLGRPIVRWQAESLIIGTLAEQDRPYGRASGLAMRHRPIWRSFLIEQRALLRELPDIAAALSRITTPTVVITGSRDPLIPARTPIALLAAVSHAMACQLDGGHDLQLRQPAEVAEVIGDFVATLAGFGWPPGGADLAGSAAAERA